MSHAIITAIYCFICCLCHYPAACIGAAGFYIGREIAQAEYRYIEHFCNRKRANMPWYAPFIPAAWTLKGMFDWIIPCIIVAGFMYGA